MVKRHNPRPSGRRRVPPIPAASGALPAAEEMVAVPLDPPEPDAVLSELPASPDREVPAQATAFEEATIVPEASSSAAEALETEPASSATDLDILGPALVALQPPPGEEEAALILPSPILSPMVAPVHQVAPFGSTDLAAAGATLQAFILNEGLAALTHWRALARSQSPAQALRLHVDEMQRAADASLTCMGRLVGHLGRIGARNAA